MLISLTELTVRYNVRPGPVLHVGAHLGEEALAYERFRFCPVWWVEGNPDKVTDLEREVSRYPANHVVSALVADRERDVVLHVANNGQSSSILELGTHATAHPEVRYVGEKRLRATTVDALHAAGTVGPATLMNIDVQGAELDVLRGAEEYLRTVQYVYTEVNAEELYRGCALLPEMDEWLNDRRFARVATALTKHGWGDALYRRISR